MRGLVKNNFLAACTNAKVFAVFMILLGLFTVAVISQPLLIGYALIGIVGFSANAIAVTKKEFTSKWGKYKLTLPVRRVDIVKSLFVNQIIWLLIGTLFAGAGVSLSWLLHGCPFDLYRDMLSLFALGISMSLFTGAIFFPLFYLGGEERSEVFLAIALLCAFGLDLVITTVINILLDPGITTALLGAAALVASSLVAFVLSCPLSAAIFKKREY